MFFTSRNINECPYLAALFPKDKNVLNAKYLYEALSHKKDEILVPLMKGAANVSMDCDDMKDVLVPVPPIENQLSIVYRANYEMMIAGAKLILNAYSQNILISDGKSIIENNKQLIKTLENKLRKTETINEVWGD